MNKTKYSGPAKLFSGFRKQQICNRKLVLQAVSCGVSLTEYRKNQDYSQRK